MTGKRKAKQNKLTASLALKFLALALVLAFLVNQFLVSSTRVDGSSMLNTLHSGDRLLVLKPGSNPDNIKRGEIIVFKAPSEDKFYIKRVVALPNEYVQIEDGWVFINGKRLEEPYINSEYTYSSSREGWYVQEGQVFVLGDNRIKGASRDSRAFGPIDGESIVGHAAFRYYPFDALGSI